MFVGQTEAGQSVDGERLRDEAGAGGTVEVPARQAGDRPALQEDFQSFAIGRGRLEAFRQDDLTGGDRMEQRKQTRRAAIGSQPEIGRRDVEPGGVPALLVPAERGQVVAATRVELRILQRRARSQDAGESASYQLAGDGGFELIADRDLPAGGQEPVHVSRGGVVREAGHRRLVSLRERQAEHLGGDLGVVAEDLIEVAEAEKQDRAFREFLTEFTVLPLHRGFLLHAKERKPREGLRKCGLPAPARTGREVAHISWAASSDKALRTPLSRRTFAVMAWPFMRSWVWMSPLDLPSR